MTSNQKDTKKEGFFAGYNHLLARYPLLINGVQAAVIAGLGVLASQVIVGLKAFDWAEVRAMMLINFAFNTPILLAFANFNAQMKASALEKLALDQLIFSPVFTVGIISLRLYLLGTNLGEIPGVVMAILPRAMKSSWMFWLPTRFLIMTYIPLNLQLLASNLGGFVWNIIFAMLISS